MALVDYVTDGIIDFLNRHPERLSTQALEDVLQMEILREYINVNDSHPVASQIELAAVRTFDGHFELFSLSAPAVTGMPFMRIGSLTWERLAEAIAILLPDMNLEDGLRQALGGIMLVPFERWLEVKRDRLQVPKSASV